MNLRREQSCMTFWREVKLTRPLVMVIRYRSMREAMYVDY